MLLYKFFTNLILTLYIYNNIILFVVHEYVFLLDLPHQVLLKRLDQSQKNKNHIKRKGKRKRRINLRKASITRRKRRRDERKRVHLQIVQTVLVVTKLMAYFCCHFCREYDDLPFGSCLFVLCNYVYIHIYFLRKSICKCQCFKLLNGPFGNFGGRTLCQNIWT